MKSTALDTRIAAALNDPATSPTNVADIGKLLLDNFNRVSMAVSRTYLTFIAFAAAFTVINKAPVDSLTLFGLVLRRDNPVVLVLPVLASFEFYHSISLLLFQQLLDRVLRAYYRQVLPAFERNGVTELLSYAAFFEIEFKYSIILGMPISWLSLVWIGLLALVCILIPALWVGMVTVWVLATFTPHTLLIWISLLLTWTFTARALLLVVHTRRY